MLFPGLLVSTREYEPLVAHLGPGQEAHGFLCASLVEAVRPLPPVADLAAAYAERVRDLMRGRAGSCVFLGWSWGGVLAYETARRLGPGFPLDWVGMLDACGLEANFAPGAGRPVEPAERAAHEALVEAWLARAPMRAHWEALRARMDPEAAVQFLRFLAAEPQPLPADGPRGRQPGADALDARRPRDPVPVPPPGARRRCRSAASWRRSRRPAACR
ncbi:thioesterase domain-containing protein [Methylobacterium oryzae CBMB20]